MKRSTIQQSSKVRTKVSQHDCIKWLICQLQDYVVNRKANRYNTGSGRASISHTQAQVLSPI